MIRVLWTLLLVLVATTVETSQNPSSGIPSRLERYLTGDVGLTTAERGRLLDGEPVTKLLKADPNKEVAVFGAIWINAPIGRYLTQLKDIERFERGGSFRLTKKITTPPRLEDFAQLRLPKEDADALRTCRVGSCEVKFSEPALRRIQTEVDWKRPDAGNAANALIQRLAFEYVTGYLEGGNERLAVYRDTSRPTFVAQEFSEMIAQMPELTAYMPEVRRYLLGYPNVTLPGSDSFLYWQEADFGLKTTIRLSHLTIQERQDDALVVSKMLYASHYFWTGLELRALIADPSRGPGFWFVTVNRSRSDGLSGFTGSVVRGRVQGEVRKRALTSLQATRRTLEDAR